LNLNAILRLATSRSSVTVSRHHFGFLGEHANLSAHAENSSAIMAGKP
jgi:hypothetical protein